MPPLLFPIYPRDTLDHILKWSQKSCWQRCMTFHSSCCANEDWRVHCKIPPTLLVFTNEKMTGLLPRWVTTLFWFFILSYLHWQMHAKTWRNCSFFTLKEIVISKSLKISTRVKITTKKFRTPSSANFLGSWHISSLKSKSYYEIWHFWFHFYNLEPIYLTIFLWIGSNETFQVF